ncbi:MAG TPA: glutaredoxin family protein [Methylomirabilota bacterium]|nr:glutaredoxin family protein [Methylomirabilota bacterium]
MIRVDVYGKRDCCLCDEAKAVLLKVQREVPFELSEIDIDSSPDLSQRYNERIPLVFVNGHLAFKFRVDEPALRRRLALELASPTSG